MSYRIKDDVIWRKEFGNLIVLSPLSKSLLVFKEDIANLIDNAGQIIETNLSEEIKHILVLLMKENIIELC